MSWSGLHRQEVMVDEDSESNLGVSVLILQTHQGLNPRALGLMSQALHPDCWQVLFLEAAAGRLALDLVLKDWEEWGVLSTPSFFPLFPHLSQGLTFLPYRRDCLPGSGVGHRLPHAFLPGIISLARPWPLPIPL